MTHYSQAQSEAVPLTSFNITQFALGSPLFFEPALGSKELDELINSYIPGSASTQQKRAQVVLEFLNSIDASSYLYPVSLRYHVPQSLTLETALQIPSTSPVAAAPAAHSSLLHAASRNQSSSASRSSASLKRPREEEYPPSSAKRLPGFSIMTKDGIDITDLASRGPKTKEQRDHAALMRKLKACAACKRSKQRCDPSHHRPAASPSNSTSSATPSMRSTVFSHPPSARGSRGSISPQSSLGESFSQSPPRAFVNRALEHGGHNFALPNPRSAQSLSNFSLQDSLLTDLDLNVLPIPDVDPELFQLAEMELDSWNTPTTEFHETDSHNLWTPYEGLFSPSHGYAQPEEMQGVGVCDHDLDVSLRHFIPDFQDGSLDQRHEPALAPHTHPQSSRTSPESCDVEFDIYQWLDSAVDRLQRNKHHTQRIVRADISTVNQTSRSQAYIEGSSLQGYDYILYPESPGFDLGLEPYLESRDIAAKVRRPHEDVHITPSEQERSNQPRSPITELIRASQSDQSRRITGSILPGSQNVESTQLETRHITMNRALEPPIGVADRYRELSADNCDENCPAFTQTKCTAHNELRETSQNSTSSIQADSNLSEDMELNHNALEREQQQSHLTGPTVDIRDRRFSDSNHTGLVDESVSNLPADVISHRRFGSTSDQRHAIQSLHDPPQQEPVLIQDMTDGLYYTLDVGVDQEAKETLTSDRTQSYQDETKDSPMIRNDPEPLQHGHVVHIPEERSDTPLVRLSNLGMSQRIPAITSDTSAVNERQYQRTHLAIPILPPGGDDIQAYNRVIPSQEVRSSQGFVQVSRRVSMEIDALQQVPPSSDESQVSGGEFYTAEDRRTVLSGRMNKLIIICVLMTLTLLMSISLLEKANSKADLSISETLDIAFFQDWKLLNYHSIDSQDESGQTLEDFNYGPGHGEDHGNINYEVPPSANNAIYGSQLEMLAHSSLVEDSVTTPLDEESVYESNCEEMVGYPTISRVRATASSTTTSSMVSSATKIVSLYANDFPSMATTTPMAGSNPRVNRIRYSMPTQDKAVEIASSSSHLLAVIKRALRRNFQTSHLVMEIARLSIKG